MEQRQVDVQPVLRQVEDHLRAAREQQDVEAVKQRQFQELNDAAAHAIRPLFERYGDDFEAVKRDPKWRTYMTIAEGLRDSPVPLSQEGLERARRTLEAL